MRISPQITTICTATPSLTRTASSPSPTFYWPFRIVVATDEDGDGDREPGEYYGEATVDGASTSRTRPW